jgi:hypothetical protein
MSDIGPSIPCQASLEISARIRGGTRLYIALLYFSYGWTRRPQGDPAFVNR